MGFLASTRVLLIAPVAVIAGITTSGADAGNSSSLLAMDGHGGAPRPPSRTSTPEYADRSAVWSVTTDLSTWTMRQGRQVMLTGNSYGW
jgi:hypothetical protein